MAERRILAISHGQADSGFSRVMRGILRQISCHYDVHQLCLFAVPGGLPPEWTTHYCEDPNDTYGFAELRRLADLLRPDAILILQDLWIVPGYLDVLEEISFAGKTVAYCPLDGTLVRPEVVLPLQTLDCLVTYVNWAKAEVETGFRQLAKKAATRIPELHVIPHGIDTGRFQPLEETGGTRAAARRRLFGEQSGLEDAFLILNGNHNQPRKRLDLTIEGFARFARGKPANVKLYLHTACGGAYADVREEAERCGVEERLILPDSAGAPPSVSDETLNLVYNACDVGVNTSAGEGWGLVSFEHGATGAAQVVPRHSACAELWEDAAILVDAVPIRKFTRMPLRMSEVEAVDVGAAFERLYEDPALRERMGAAAQANARRDDWSWPVVGRQWKGVLDQVLQ